MKRQIINFTSGKIGFQKYFQSLHSMSIYGMNYGNGGDFKKSGEKFAAEYVKSKISEEDTQLIIFDVGANLGYYSIELSNIFAGKNFKIHSFEPSKKTFGKFVENTYKIKSIIPNNFGFSDIENKLLLYTDHESSALASVYQRNLVHFGISMAKSEEIILSTVDSYCKNNKIEHVHFLKLDIEGHELNALKGAINTINDKKINFIQFEFGGCNIDSRTYFQDFWYLLKDKYDFFRIVKNGLYPIKIYKENLEIFTTINYLLELKSS